MKILFVVPDLVIGGVTTVVLNIIHDLQKKNVDVMLVTLCDRCDVNISGIDHQTLGLKSIFDIPNSILNMRKIICSFKPDVVHTHTLYSHLLVYFCSYFNKSYKLISSDHGTYTSKLKFYKRMNLFKLMNSIADLITNVSDASCESYINQNIVSREKIRTMYNGIDLNKFKFSHKSRLKLRQKLAVDSQTKVIGSVGRLSQEKNIPNLISAVALLDLDYKLVIIGNGTEFNNINKIINNKKIEQKVIFLGELKDPSEYYSAFDLLVLSSNTEGLPTVILEAIASKCPVVTTDCGGVKEIFPDNYNYIVPKSDSYSLSQKIHDILNLDKNSLEGVVDSNYRRLLSIFSLKNTVNQWLDLYKELLYEK